MNKLSQAIIAFFLLTLVAGCSSSVKPVALQLREYQVKSYQGKDTREIFHAVLNTLQDDGFVVDIADVDSGLIKANMSNTAINARETLQKTAFTLLSGGIFLLFTDGNINNAETLTATITISPYGKSTKLRTSFVFKKMNPDGEIIENYQIMEREMYQQFFTAIEHSIFYDENLGPKQVSSGR
ncbi:hypothetical protein [Thalassomonas actiniarum]|uniref:Lipoprotein n=1 Tax=Thalassomonas actiniarum TaxID=485447 RepID=A0AAE9YTW0_9GAMM|nr:hypothetical protein [Thalassomonas actiniarum]WDE00185.1 hypothetical protein SG35_005905 [Thalassomonas actiniarum]